MIPAIYLLTYLTACLAESHHVQSWSSSGFLSSVNSVILSTESVASPTPHSTINPTVNITTGTMADITLSNPDNGRTVTLKSGQTIVLRLNENPSTGYRWALLELNTQSLHLTGDRFEASNTSLVGSGGQRILTFEADQLGQTTLELQYKRAWEDATSAADSFHLTVQVVR